MYSSTIRPSPGAAMLSYQTRLYNTDSASAKYIPPAKSANPTRLPARIMSAFDPSGSPPRPNQFAPPTPQPLSPSTPQPMRLPQPMPPFQNQQSNEPSPNKSQEPRVFVHFAVYKKRSAMQVSIVKPTFRQQGPSGLVMERAGGLMLEFANAVGERQYDWSKNKKQLFMLSALEAAELANSSVCQFFHDPNMGRKGAGSIYKKFSSAAMPDGNGFFFNLTVTGGGMAPDQGKMMVPISHAELYVLKNLIDYSIPHVTGFSAVIDPTLASLAVGGEAM
eukprot:CAMPEP_0198199214 /NCGR_PEP_ID=MMETSP1445-20131203/2541_1 /TAXON_ID=36898 /ORGANISM="Pyramimonas sp., Strain CCMP2087" /LENGTH=276 /DNA_ID=CAMNT_0043868983 /DNA_START=131 /DNA_END=961 /DNA_ORIENTATION=+